VGVKGKEKGKNGGSEKKKYNQSKLERIMGARLISKRSRQHQKKEWSLTGKTGEGEKRGDHGSEENLSK